MLNSKKSNPPLGVWNKNDFTYFKIYFLLLYILNDMVLTPSNMFLLKKIMYLYVLNHIWTQQKQPNNGR